MDLSFFEGSERNGRRRQSYHYDKYGNQSGWAAEQPWEKTTVQSK